MQEIIVLLEVGKEKSLTSSSKQIMKPVVSNKTTAVPSSSSARLVRATVAWDRGIRPDIAPFFSV